MSLNKAIEHHKEHRKPYKGAKAISTNCRNHGGCLWCENNRQHQKIKDKKKALDKLNEWYYNQYRKTKEERK